MKKVVILYRFLPHYRVEFYNKLRATLLTEGIELHLIYGKSKNKQALKQNEVDLPWAKYVPHSVFDLFGINFIWQPYLKHIKNADLVIVEQANRLLFNYILMFYKPFRKFKLAFWGHGRNRQLEEQSFPNQFKRKFIKACDWWFSYTEGVKKYVIESGFDENRITVVQNAIDTINLSKHYDIIPETETEALRKKLNITTNHVCLFCGAIYKEKRIDFLLKACDKIKEQIPDFVMIVLGSGEDMTLIKDAQKSRPWLHFEGNKFGLERLPYFKISSLVLMPGLVGLVILDCLATKTPLVTTKYPFHSPEVEYLINGENGIITANNLNDYVSAIVETIKDEEKLAHLIEGCVKDRTTYNIDNMVINFKKGIIQCLNI
ncbi:MAG: glycosyltransferase family 4 protein [Thermoflexibacter sp.]|jgi:glycosyltransferase involved in cell wall biosynthesis|nr:glycosyltransferase family 4 protein [Thermoflexibacter sp.]